MPANEPAWEHLNDLKDIVDLVVAPSRTKDSIAYLAFRISEHRIRFQEVFSETKLLPKHHYQCSSLTPRLEISRFQSSH